MMTTRWIGTGALALAVTLVGCEPAAKNAYKTSQEIQESGVVEAAKHDHHDHHSEPGPHKGALHEVGEDEFHLELVVDHDQHAMTIYLLGSDAKTAAMSTAAEIVVADGDKKYTLKAAPQDGETDGKSSRYVLIDDKVVHDLIDAGFLHGSTTVNLGEKEFNVNIDAHFDEHHDHDHPAEPAKAPAQPAEPAAAAPPAEAAPAASGSAP